MKTKLFYCSVLLQPMSSLNERKPKSFQLGKARSIFIFSGSITASAVCLFRFDRTEFYRIFTGPSKKNSRTNDFQSLVEFCPNSIPSTIDRDLVETEQEFLPYSSNPLIVETMSNDRFTALDVIQHRNQSFFMIIGTSQTEEILDFQFKFVLFL